MKFTMRLVGAACVAMTAVALSSCALAGKPGAMQSYDFNSIKPDPVIAAMVPQANRDTLRVAMELHYSPAEFLDDANQPVGYEVDVLKALAKVMGIKEVQFIDEDFDSIIPKVNEGTDDLGMAALTLNKERLRQGNMVSYVEAGYSYATQRDNPKDFDPVSPCGFTVAAQSDTTQADTLQAASDQCVLIGKSPVTIITEPDQDKLISQVDQGSIDAIIGETPILAYNQAKYQNFEMFGEPFETAPQGPFIAKDNAELAKAVRAGLQKMMDTGMLADVLSPWGEETIALHYATLNPPIA